MDVSQQRVHEIRRLLKQPKATIKPLRPSVVKRLQRVRANLHRLRGLTMTQAAKLLGMKLNSQSIARQYLNEQGVLRQLGPSKQVVNRHAAYPQEIRDDKPRNECKGKAREPSVRD
jgi:hypothetical protein